MNSSTTDYLRLEESGAFIEEPDGEAVDATYYSPWRVDPRPAYGVFHAAYVFERVLLFWNRFLSNGTFEGLHLRYTGYRAAKLTVQIRLATEQLQRRVSAVVDRSKNHQPGR